MLRNEAEELKKLIDSFVVEVEAEPLTEVEEGEVVPEDVVEVKEPVELTEQQLKQAFRHQVPENFDPKKVEMVRSPMTGDRVFLKYEDERRWIPDLETLEAFGFNLSDVKEKKDDEMRALKEGFGLLSKKLW
jgi:hypothetical protein